MRLIFVFCLAFVAAALAATWAVSQSRAPLVPMWSTAAASKIKNLYASRSNEYPRFTAPYSDTPPSCVAAYRQLDGNRDGRLDNDILILKRKVDTKDADQCIADKGWSWAYYLKGRTLSAQQKYGEAARHAEAALAVIRQPGHIPPPADEIWLFRANALMDAGRPAEAKPIYDALIAKRPNDRLLFQLRDSPTWPPPPDAPAS